MSNKELPNNCEDVMITFRIPNSQDLVTKRGYYVNVLGTFAIPYEWGLFNGALLPRGLGGWRWLYFLF